jgi:hypothetical protein
MIAASSARYRLVRVHPTAWLLPVEEVLHKLPNTRDSRRTTHQHDVRDIALRHVRITQHLLHGVERAPEQVVVQLLENCTRYVILEVTVLAVESVRFARSHAIRSVRSARALLRRSHLNLFWERSAKYSTIRSSKSSPPK